jgi:hypothetical protein
MFGFAAFSDAGFSAQTTADARIIAGTQVVTSTVAGATILGGAIITVSGNSMTSSVGTPTGLVIAFPGTNVMTSSIAGVTTGVVIPIGSANLGMTSTVQAMGSEYTLKLIKIPETNLLTGSTGSPSLFTWVDVNDNVTAETWTDVETEDSTESWSNV